MAQASFEPGTFRSRILRSAVVRHWLGVLEGFVCNLYGEARSITVSEAALTKFKENIRTTEIHRQSLSQSRGANRELFPSCQDVLCSHTQCSHLVTSMWRLAVMPILACWIILTTIGRYRTMIISSSGSTGPNFGQCDS